MVSDSISEQVVQQTEQSSKEKSNRLKFNAVIRAFLANISIALIKLISWYFTKSSAMFAEAVHSAVDSFNSVCLMVGLKRGSRPADGVHPFGHGLETNIWTIIASILMFFGSAVSLLSSYNKLVHNDYEEVMIMINNYEIPNLINKPYIPFFRMF